MCDVLSLGYRETVYQTADLKSSTGLTYPNKLYLTSPVSCTKQLKFSAVINIYVFSHFCGLTHPALSFSSCLCVLSGSAPLSGLDTVAGQLQECEATSQVSASVSILPTSIIKQLRSFYSHQLQCRSPPLPPLSPE